MTFNDLGFKILRNAISKETCAELMSDIHYMWETSDNCISDPHPCDIVGLETVVQNDSKVLYKNSLEIPNKAITPFKITDLYLVSYRFRKFLDNPILLDFLHKTLETKPILVSSLTVEYGTEQRTHIDSIFSCPPASDRHVTIWLALEDTHKDSGRVGYFTGSHTIDPYVFSNGLYKIPGTIDRANGKFSRSKQTKSEYDDWLKYITSNLNEAPCYFDANAGDIIAWHGRLVHFGSPRVNPALTRRSIICFFHASEEYNANVIDFGNFDYLYKPMVPRIKL